MLKQTELIKSALNELGCEEVPSGCDLSIDNQTFISNSSEQVRTNITIMTTVFSRIRISIIQSKSNSRPRRCIFVQCKEIELLNFVSSEYELVLGEKIQMAVRIYVKTNNTVPIKYPT